MIYLHLNYKERPPRSSLIQVHHRVPRAARGPTFYSPSTCHPLNLSLRTVIYNFEDYGIAELLNLKARMPTPDDKPALNILVLRDPLNLLASRVKKYRRTGALGMIGQPFIEHYLEWCRAAAAEGLPLKNAIVVNFNLWVTSKTYRASLAAHWAWTSPMKG